MKAGPLLLCLASLGLAWGNAAIAGPTFAVFDGPGANHGTEVFGINAAGDVTGIYDIVSPLGRAHIHCFLRSANGSMTTVQVGKDWTRCWALNEQGVVVGDLEEPPQHAVSHGFVRSLDGTIATFDLGFNQQTCPRAINAAGSIAGYYWTPVAVHGFLRNPQGNITPIDVPKAQSTSAVAVNANGVVAGYTDNPNHGFIRAVDGTFTKFAVHDAGVSDVSVVDINAGGEVIGRYTGRHSTSQLRTKTCGFLRKADGMIVLIEVPDAKDTWVTGINDLGDVVGIFDIKQPRKVLRHGFLRTADGDILIIDVPGGAVTSVADINDSGQIAGSFKDANSVNHGFVRTP